MAASDAAGGAEAQAAAATAQPGARAEPLLTLYEQHDLPRLPLPLDLEILYGGELGFLEPCLYANFVSSVDGVVALGPEHPSSGSTISGRAPGDRFVMGLLRACAHAVLIGAGTLRATPNHRWLPDHVYPAAAPEFAAVRHARQLPVEPELAVVTASGRLPVGHLALQAGAVIATTAAGAARLDGRLPPACTVLSLADGPTLHPATVVQALRERGHAMILSEAGPRLTGQFVEDALLDELFLTVSPVLAGRGRSPRDGLISGLELLPERRETGELLSLRHQGSLLFLRYRLTPPSSVSAA